MQLLVIMQALVHCDSAKEQLMQVATGSGKSEIIAALVCLGSGGWMNVYTSSGVLAERE